MNDTHPEPAEIAALDAELLEPEQAAWLRDHLAGCASCAEVQADLDMLGRELADIPSPPIPADVAARINATLETEAAAVVSRETPPRRARSRGQARRWPRLVLAASAALVVLGVGGTLLMGARDAVESALTSSEDAADAGGGVAASDDSLEARVHELLTLDEREALQENGESVPHSAGDTPKEVDAQADGGGTGTLPPCVRAALDRDDPPLAAAQDDYQGQRAYVVVFPHRGDPELVDAYAYADCTGDAGDRGKLLAQGSYARP